MSLAVESSSNSRPTNGNPLDRFLKATILNPRWLAIITLFVIWHVYAMIRDTRVIPPPMKVLTTMWDILSSGVFFEHLVASMVRILAGFVATMLVGTTVGVLMGSRRSWEEFFKDLVLFGLALPGLIYALFAVMLFGVSILAPITGILGTAYPFVAINVSEGVKALDKELLDMSRAYKVGRWTVVRKVILPCLLPFFLGAIRVGFAIAWKVSTLIEMFGAESGVGYMIRGSFDSYSVHGMVAWALLFGGLMLIIEYGILLPAERRLAAWRPKVERVV